MVRSHHDIVQGIKFIEVCDVVLVARNDSKMTLALASLGARHVVYYEDIEEGRDSVARLQSATSIMVCTDDLSTFVRLVCPMLCRPVVVVLHNSDEAVHDQDIESLGVHVRVVFAQNLCTTTKSVNNKVVYPLPIGIANSIYEHGNVQRLAFMSSFAFEEGWKTKWCYYWFREQTNPQERIPCKNAIDKLHSFQWNVDRPFAKYLAELLAHRYAICPVGNGVDTHRFWECLYLGVIPVVSYSCHFDHWPMSDMPVLVVNEWGDISLPLLQERYSELRNRFTDETLRAKWDYVLSFSFYRDSIRSSVSTVAMSSDSGSECRG